MNEGMVNDLTHTMKTVRRDRKRSILILACIYVALACCAGLGINWIVMVVSDNTENPFNMGICGTIQTAIATFLWASSRKLRINTWNRIEADKLAALEIKTAIEAAKKDDMMEVGIRVMYARGFIDEIKD
jgi:flagellar basal body-associated protein FliL